MHGEQDASCSRNDTTEESVKPRPTSKCNQIQRESVVHGGQNCSISKSDMKSVLFSASRSKYQHYCKINFIKSKSLSSEGEERNYLISEDSSEPELADMILGDDYSQGDRIAVPSSYSCPLCCEGSMITIKQALKDTLPASEKPHTEDTGSAADTNRMNHLSIKKHLNISSNSRLNSQYSKGDHGSSSDYDPVEQDSDPEGDDSNSNSFILSHTKVKEEDDNNIESTAAKDNREYDKRDGIMTINSNQGNLIIKSEKTEDDNPVSCLVCRGTLMNLNRCLVHALSAHANSETHSYPCSLCEMCFSVDTDLTRHFLTVHQNIKVRFSSYTAV
jgi:hypothetical protein